MSLDGPALVSSYVDWLKSKMLVQDINGYLEITTPFLDRHNDHMQIYVQRKDDSLILTDDGYTINDLEMTGIDFKGEGRKRVLDTILNGFGVKVSDGALVVEARTETFPQKKHALLQAMLSVDDMFMTSTRRVASLFLEDVETFLNENDVRFSPAVQFTGKSGFVNGFDFVIPKSRTKPERLISAVNNPTKSKVQQLLFSWSDTKSVRQLDTAMYVILNDVDKTIRTELFSALRQYDVNPVLWSEKENIVREFAS